jgi:poly(3-hydroxybutyrate) depolymerase
VHNFSPADFNSLYHMVEASRIQMSPLRLSILGASNWFENTYNPLYYSSFAKTMRASLDIAERITRKYQKPQFNITECSVGDKLYNVKQETILTKTFCHLQHFSKIGITEKQPKLLVVAPMAGHHATLLRGTVQDTLPYFDIYITDWLDASQVPLDLGGFNMDNFIDYIIEFIQFLGSNSDTHQGDRANWKTRQGQSDIHVMAVCQPTVPVLAASSIMAANNDPRQPKSMILIGGPVDASKSPTAVNMFATGKSMEWFERMVIMPVPPNLPGYRRLVYPGFLQLAGFLSLNVQRHISSHIDLFKSLLIEDDAEADRQTKFYDEYFSVMDLPAEFYLQTIKEVFLDFSLAKGHLISRGRKIDPSTIKNCAVLSIEGENDDISGVGQTKAALNLCTNIPAKMKEYYLQKGVGHYGVFSGSKFRQFIVPVIRDFIYKLEKK